MMPALIAPIDVPMIQSGSISRFMQRLIHAGLDRSRGRPPALQAQARPWPWQVLSAEV